MFFSYLSLILNYIVPLNTPIDQVVTKPRILFFSGGNALMPTDIYSDFISKLGNNFEVNIIKNKYTTTNDENTIIEQLFEYASEKEIIPIGHSSGCTTLLNYCSKLKNIKKCVLLDPVDNNLNKNININYDSILQINAEKSYKWKPENINFLNPSTMIPKLPFIPFFAMDLMKIKNEVNVTKIEIKDYGHCDILDTTFSNIMHNSIAEGNENRNSLNEYKLLLTNLINNYINDISLPELSDKIEYSIE